MRAPRLWQPTCDKAFRTDIYVFACPGHDPVLARDCEACKHNQSAAPKERGPMRQQQEPEGKRGPGRPRQTDPNAGLDVAETLRQAGFTKAAASAVAPNWRGGKFLVVCGAKGVPTHLAIARDLVVEAGLENGMEVDVYYRGGHDLALLIGAGDLRLCRHASGLALRCPALLAKHDCKVQQRFPAQFKDGVILTVLKSTDANE